MTETEGLRTVDTAPDRVRQQPRKPLNPTRSRPSLFTSPRHTGANTQIPFVSCDCCGVSIRNNHPVLLYSRNTLKVSSGVEWQNPGIDHPVLAPAGPFTSHQPSGTCVQTVPHIHAICLSDLRFFESRAEQTNCHFAAQRPIAGSEGNKDPFLNP